MSTQNTHLHIDGVSKNFGDVKALSNIDLKIERGSFVCLLGPSGCGKTTLLRIIAGFESASSGRLLLDGSDIAQVPPHKRGFGMVFQSLALFPHMSVARNIAYGLKLRGVSGKEQRDRVEELLNVIQLPSIADRPVSALSGGQRQRVAIARALAIQPKLFLLDEPLSALDAKLRDNMQIELRQLQQKFGVTTILVTHDQHEAMMLADELVVLKDGAVRQSAAPSVVYQQPADSFVADFLGAANLINVGSVQGGQVQLLGKLTAVDTAHADNTMMQAAVRAEHISLAPVAQAGGAAVGTIEFMRDLGPSTEIVVAVDGESLRVRSPNVDCQGLSIGTQVAVSVDPSQVSVFKA
ncbi:ABC transporter ATP-binding protein [Litoreibacter albidus]|uniref:Putative spermidine/putrescine transport system ATP-binding protein n=1 Tax=Litoreibacter albidus TaxID=670155 RepID=A0A1H3CMJ6_9RHOB|nr:ABC transporter ATP-binding protein [Litoreibacter albidus]SDX55118.1 putative spermidine/putrescine transport system ATP-binding protein [Litoreibacter albidus]